MASLLLPTKSQEDKRSYRVIEIQENGLQCLLVSDPKSDKV